MKKFLIIILLLLNLPISTHANEFIKVINDKAINDKTLPSELYNMLLEECFIEGFYKDTLMTGFGVCKKTYEYIKEPNEDNFNVYMYGSYENGKKNGLFIEIAYFSENFTTVSFTEYKNNMKNGYFIELTTGFDDYWIFQFINDIEQGLSLIRNEYKFMVDAYEDFEHEITPDEIKKFEAGFNVFSELIEETYEIKDIKKHSSSLENIIDLINKGSGIMSNFYSSMYSKYGEPKVYKH